jgi:hypothetical protein
VCRAGERSGGRDGASERTGERGGRGETGVRGEHGGAGASRGEARGAVSRLDTTKRTEFRQSITRSGVSRVDNVNFSLSV